MTIEILETVAGWRKVLSDARARDQQVGLVPTMGSLHAGHASLVRRAAAECDVVGVTVFVNPLQFGQEEDFDDYPRQLESDASMAAGCGARWVFAPPVAEMYPTPVVTTVKVARIGDRWEGASRPGHFDGVATVVAKLFAQAGPCRAYFGEKDFQQLAVVRAMALDLSFPVEILGCPIVRAPDGLALSSRNAYLTDAQRAAAPTLFRALQAGAAAVAARTRGVETSPAEIRRCMADVVAGEPQLVLDYAAVVDSGTLDPALTLAGELRLLIAARLGRTRLIDNLGVNA